jgi:3-methyladenine DNA glycosylase AlkD
VSPSTKSVLAHLERIGTAATRDGMARYGIVAKRAFGVPVGAIKAYGKVLGRDHGLAAALWKSGWYEARLLAAFVDEPDRVTAAQMDAWCRDFDNWGVVDTVCFHLFDRTPHAFRKIEQWAKRKPEFEKRAAFALLACVALHDKNSPDAAFLRCLPLIERASTDDRNFVRKGVSWALRMVGRRSKMLHTASLGLAKRFSTSDNRTARWLGNDVLRDLGKVSIRQ